MESFGRLTWFAIGLAALLSAACPVAAQSPAAPDPDTLRVVYTVLPPYITDSGKHGPDGFAVEVLRAVAADAGMTATWRKAATITEALELIAAGEADVHPALVSNAARREVVDYTSAIQVVTISLFALRHRAEEFDPKDLKGLRIGYRAGSAGRDAAHAILGAHPVAVPTDDSTYDALVAGEVDLAVFVDAAFDRRTLLTTEAGARFVRIGPPVLTSAVGIPVSKARPDLLARLDESLRRLKSEARFDAMNARWFGPPQSWWTPQRVAFAVFAGFLTFAAIALFAFTRLRRSTEKLLSQEARLRADLDARHAEMLERKNAQLAHQNEEMQRLLQAVSHDLKSPMVTVRGFAGILEDAMKSGDTALAADACRRIIASTGHLSGITDGLQEFNRVDRRPVEINLVDLNELVEEAEEMLSADIEAAGARIDIPAPLPKVRADESQLLRVLLNLIVNALRHGCPEPGMSIEITARPHAEATEIIVRDHGPGIPDAFHGDVFRLFRRLAPGQSDGTGIGLSIVARIAAKHGGTAWATSPEGGGAALHFTIQTLGADKRHAPNGDARATDEAAA